MWISSGRRIIWPIKDRLGDMILNKTKGEKMGFTVKQALAILACMALGHGALASEYRIWSDKKGNSIEAKFVCESAGRIVIRDRKEKTYKFVPEKLSAADQKYLRTAFPPTIEIVYSKKQDRTKDKGYSDWAWVDMKCEILIKKKSRMPYDESLKVVLLVVGRDDRESDYILLDREEASFDFTKSKSFLLKGNEFRMREYGSYSSNRGTEYTGYLAVVLDKDGNVIEMKSNRKEFAEKFNMMLKIKKGSHFDKDMRVRSTSNKNYY